MVNCLYIQVTIEAKPETNKSYAQPGERVVLTAQTSPFAVVRFLAMDEGLFLMATGNDFPSLKVSSDMRFRKRSIALKIQWKSTE